MLIKTTTTGKKIEYTNGQILMDGVVEVGELHIMLPYEVTAMRKQGHAGLTHRWGRICFTAPQAAQIEAVDAPRLAAEQAAREDLEKYTISIYLSSRGWGDYSPVTWVGDCRKTDAKIIAECRRAIATSNDVDTPNITDAEIITLIAAARAKIAAPAKTEKPETHGAGYCYSCETYCYGDCGNYQPQPTHKNLMRELKQANDEMNCGIND